MKIKICGITSQDDALAAANAGADMIGMIFSQSPRMISKEKAKEISAVLPKKIEKVGVFVNEKSETINTIFKDCALDYVQLHGDESPEFCRKVQGKTIKVFRIAKAEDLLQIKNYNNICTAIMLDTFVAGKPGGTGKTFDWKLARAAKNLTGLPIFLSGGLTPRNVKQAIETVQPYAVDVCSGVESAPGKKDRQLIELFIKNSKS